MSTLLGWSTKGGYNFRGLGVSVCWSGYGVDLLGLGLAGAGGARVGLLIPLKLMVQGWLVTVEGGGGRVVTTGEGVVVLFLCLLLFPFPLCLGLIFLPLVLITPDCCA